MCASGHLLPFIEITISSTPCENAHTHWGTCVKPRINFVNEIISNIIFFSNANKVTTRAEYNIIRAYIVKPKMKPPSLFL